MSRLACCNATGSQATVTASLFSDAEHKLTAQRMQADADSDPLPVILSTAQAEHSTDSLPVDGVLQAGLQSPDSVAAVLPPSQQPAPAQGSAVEQGQGTSNRADSPGGSLPLRVLDEELPPEQLSWSELQHVASTAGPAGMRRIFSSKSQRQRGDSKEDSSAPQPGPPADTSHGPDASEPVLPLPDSLAEQGHRSEGPGHHQAGSSHEPSQGSTSQQQPSIIESSKRALTGGYLWLLLGDQTHAQGAGTFALPPKRTHPR